MAAATRGEVSTAGGAAPRIAHGEHCGRNPARRARRISGRASKSEADGAGRAARCARLTGWAAAKGQRHAIGGKRLSNYEWGSITVNLLCVSLSNRRETKINENCCIPSSSNRRRPRQLAKTCGNQDPILWKTGRAKSDESLRQSITLFSS